MFQLYFSGSEVKNIPFYKFLETTLGLKFFFKQIYFLKAFIFEFSGFVTILGYHWVLDVYILI